MSTEGQSVGMVRRLVLKDLYFQRWWGVGTVATGAVALMLLAGGGEAGFHAGAVLLVTALICLGALTAVHGVVDERKEQTLLFVMTLPISTRHYVGAKLLASLIAFTYPFALLLASTIGVFHFSDALPGGWIPFVTVVFGEIYLSTALLLAVALLTESTAWTVSTIIAGNLFFNFFIFGLFRRPSFYASLSGDVAVWHREALMLLALEAACIVLLLGAAYVLAAGRRDVL